METNTNRESTFDINNLKYEFKVDKERFTVEYGGAVFHASTSYTPLSILNKYHRVGYGKVGYKRFNNEYGITARTLAKCINKEFMDMLVVPIRSHVSRYCFNVRSCDMHIVQLIHTMLPVLNQCKSDNIENIAPICLLLGANPSDCKAKLGKSLWKQLCKNSLTKNVLMYKQCMKEYISVTRNPIETLTRLNNFKSKYLKRGLNIRTTDVKNFDNYGLWVIETGGSYNIAKDTDRMAENLNEKFSLKWSPEKMQKMHDRYSLLLQRKREEELLREQAEYGKQWKAVEPYLPCQTIELNGYVATLIKTPLELHREGEAMHHCVGGYANSVERGVYLVYSITKDGERVSTLGVQIVVPIKQEKIGDLTDLNLAVRPVEIVIELAGAAGLNQHYGKYNSKIVEETPLQLADLVVESLNELMKEKH